ncbi:MAG TPA: UDP-N-acetylmuramoyl-L-alanine--D-glutamate ligase [Abditibacteriaceae bacterium]|jgi:UDP-N-acetylmuramoylalanine--D-glutamate ligase
MQREKVCGVVGLARAGVPAARFLAERGARVLGFDAKPRTELSADALALEALGVELRVGDSSFAGLKECTQIILSPGLKIHHEPLRSVLVQCEARGADIIGELELAARHCPAPMIAVTGTKGKSTTTKLIEEMLAAAGVSVVRAGNSGIPLIAELSNLSPDSWAVVEVSSFQLEKAPTLKPRIAVLLNLLADHQDYHTSLDQYWQTKLKLFANQGEGDTAIWNLDDAHLAAMKSTNQLPQTGAKQVLTTSGEWNETTNPCVCARKGFLGFSNAGGFEKFIALDEIPLRGAHNASNVAAALAAVETALAQNNDDFDAHCEAIREAVRNFASLPHRLEKVGVVDGVQYINDSQATIPEAAMRALEAYPAPVTLICGGLDKLGDPHGYDALGETAARSAHLLVTIGQAAPLIEAAARRAGMPDEKIISAENLTNAVESATIRTPAGGTVVLSPACASFDQFKSYEERGEIFRSLVAQLETRQSASLVPARENDPASPQQGVAR